MWQGRPADVEEMKHLLDDFVVDFYSMADMGLGLVLRNPDGSETPPVVMNLGDTVVLEKDDVLETDRIGIVKAERFHA